MVTRDPVADKEHAAEAVLGLRVPLVRGSSQHFNCAGQITRDTPIATQIQDPEIVLRFCVGPFLQYDLMGITQK